MKFLKFTLAAILLTLCAGVVTASVKDLPTKVVEGRKMHYYQVAQGETIYSLTKKLGIDREAIESCNPAVVDGLKAGMTLYFPADDKPLATSATSTTRGGVTHTIEKGETIYGICKKYGISEDELMKLNPGIVASALRAGDTLIIKAAAPTHREPTRRSVASQAPAQPTEYTIRDGETLYAIANAHGVSVDDILAANPSMSATFYRGGDRITIPAPGYALNHERTVATSTPQPTATPKTIEIIETVEADAVEPSLPEVVETIAALPRESSIAVILPLQKYAKTRTKASGAAAEFMRGFLIAVDTLKTSQRPIKLYVYDSAANADTLRAILRKPELKKVQMIVAPGDSAHLATIDAFGRKNGIMVMNPFLGYNNDYVTSSSMMQATVPRNVFAQKAAQGVAENYPGRTPVLLRRKGGPRKEKEFVESLVGEYLAQGIEPLTLTYDETLPSSSLEHLLALDSNFIFIPYESSNKEAQAYLPALAEFTASLQSPERVMVMGYPEWIVFSGDSRKNMERTNTVIYTRFTADNGTPAINDVTNQFNYWYRRAIEPGFPRQALLGIDLGMYIIRALRANGGNFDYISPSFDGLQGGYHFVKTDDNKGWYNDMMYLLKFHPTGIIDKITL